MFIAAYIGQFAALATSVAWSFTSVFFTMSGRRVGSAVVNRTRLLFAIVLVILTHRLMEGSFLPLDAEPFRWGWLALSGLIGFVLGDAALFQAFVMIGPRLSMLLMALSPVFSTMLAWVLLAERLTPLELLGIGLSVGGVMIVVSDRQNGSSKALTVENPRQYLIGVLFGLAGALGQSVGLYASRMGLVGDFSALSGNLIRLIAAAISIWLFTALRGQVRAGFVRLRQEPIALRYLIGGAIAGPFLGVWLSLVAVQKAPLGVASTLMSLAPVILIPISRLMFGDRVTPRAIAGTVVAFAGTALLFM
ncbi:MAG: DMT family transporter [Anaerolineae bacterium]|nr:DMT family transporter [Anaerolineae bacterium]